MLETNCSLQISDWDAIIMKAVKCGLIENDPEYGFIRVFRKLVKKANIDKSIVSKSFELLAGYSQFSNIMLSRDAKQLQKGNLVLILVIANFLNLKQFLTCRRSIKINSNISQKGTIYNGSKSYSTFSLFIQCIIISN